MVRRMLLMAATIVALSVIALAAAKPNFNGGWTLDRARSFGMPGNMTQTLTIAQTEDKIEVETKLIQPGNERTVKDTYNLDGKEATSEVTFGQNSGQLTTKATMSGDSLELMRKTAFGDRVGTTTQKLSLSDGGKTLTTIVVLLYVRQGVAVLPPTRAESPRRRSARA